MTTTIAIDDRLVGHEQPVYVIGEIGLNHNGEAEIAKQLIDVAVDAGCDAVKFQKRTPEICVPEDQRDIERETPWGKMTYMEYRYRIEFGKEEYQEIDSYCREKGIQWFVSPWDIPSVDFIEQFDPVAYKVASASLTDIGLLDRLQETERPIILSTGMSTPEEIDNAIERIDNNRILLAHCTSAYPCDLDEVNLRVITNYMEKYKDIIIGYSGHERGLQVSLAAVALGARFIERHITLDHTMWGSDHAASLEPNGLKRLVRDIRAIESAMGDGVKRVYDSELPLKKKLRRI